MWNFLHTFFNYDQDLQNLIPFCASNSSITKPYFYAKLILTRDLRPTAENLSGPHAYEWNIDKELPSSKLGIFLRIDIETDPLKKPYKHLLTFFFSYSLKILKAASVISFDKLKYILGDDQSRYVFEQVHCHPQTQDGHNSATDFQKGLHELKVVANWITKLNVRKKYTLFLKRMASECKQSKVARACTAAWKSE